MGATRGRSEFRRYHDTVFERFWRRELDIESVPGRSPACCARPAPIADAFPEWVAVGRTEVASIVAEAEALGVFGVPSFIVNGELFWGREHLPDIRAMLEIAA